MHDRRAPFKRNGRHAHKRPLPVGSQRPDSPHMRFKVGDQAPDFEVTARQGGQSRVISLQRVLAERSLVLYFYPRDFTLVCTREACGFRDSRLTH